MKGLERQKGESEVAHRSLLLWGMQTPKRRNRRAVGRAVGRSHATIGEFAKRWKWKERTSSLTADAECQALYRELYFEKYGMAEIGVIQKNIASAVTVMGTTPRNVTEAVKKTMGHTPKPGDKLDKEIKKKHLMLIDAAIGYIAQGIKEGDIRRTLRDLPTLLTLRNELVGENKPQEGSRLVSESVRVKDAKASGGDVVEAMYEDAQEITAILGALRMRGKAVPHQEEEVNA